MIQTIKKGYKQTEVGVIPVDWSVSKLVEVCSKITDGTHDTPKPTETGIPFLIAIHVKENSIDFGNCYFLPKVIHDEIYRRCNPEKNDVLMVNIGAGVATTAVVYVDYEFSLKNVALLKPNTKHLLGPYLNSYQLFIKDKIRTSMSSGGAQPFLSLNQIGALKIPLPPTKAEQTAIATALSDTYRCPDCKPGKTHCKKTKHQTRGNAKTAYTQREVGSEEVGGNCGNCRRGNSQHFQFKLLERKNQLVYAD